MQRVAYDSNAIDSIAAVIKVCEYEKAIITFDTKPTATDFKFTQARTAALDCLASVTSMIEQAREKVILSSEIIREIMTNISDHEEPKKASL